MSHDTVNEKAVADIANYIAIKLNETDNDTSIIPVSCAICGKIHVINKDALKNEMISELYNYGFTIINDKLYCKECANQYNKLVDNNKPSLRPSKHEYYLNIAKEVASRATCLRRKYGAVIVKNDIIISTGYNGAPRGTDNCIDLNYCRRDKLNIPRGENYELCRAVHSEMNAIINAEREKMIDSTLYLYGEYASNGNIVENLDSCQLCKKIIINAGIKTVIFARPNNEYYIVDVNDWIINDETLTDKKGY